jgi:tetratricopeptide (TPR) repeat protein
LGRTQDALGDFEKAISLEPNWPYAYCERAWLWSVEGERDKMLQDLNEAVVRAPSDYYSWMNRSWLLATAKNDVFRDGKQALEDATKACELSRWLEEDALDCLAAAHAENGDFAKAIEFQERAIARATYPNPEYQKRLERYRAGKPYRNPFPAWK